MQTATPCSIKRALLYLICNALRTEVIACTIARTSVTEQRRSKCCAVRTFCMLSGGSKDSLLQSCYNQPITHIAQYYCRTILMSLHMERLTVRESKPPRILVSWLS